jgi:hypothetical protein
MNVVCLLHSYHINHNPSLISIMLSTNVVSININLKTVKTILTLVQLIFINSIVYYIILSIYRYVWVILLLVAVSVIKQVCFPPSPPLPPPPLPSSSQVSPPQQIEAVADATQIKKNGKLCMVCDVSCKSKCQSCKKVYYCCRNHQLIDWKKHKKICNVIVIN